MLHLFTALAPIECYLLWKGVLLYKSTRIISLEIGTTCNVPIIFTISSRPQPRKLRLKSTPYYYGNQVYLETLRHEQACCSHFNDYLYIVFSIHILSFNLDFILRWSNIHQNYFYYSVLIVPFNNFDWFDSKKQNQLLLLCDNFCYQTRPKRLDLSLWNFLCFSENDS